MPAYTTGQLKVTVKGATSNYERLIAAMEWIDQFYADISNLQVGAAPGWGAAIDTRWYVADTSTSTTTYTGTTTPSATGNALFTGFSLRFKPATTNTAASTLSVGSTDGAVSIRKYNLGSLVTLSSGDLVAGNFSDLRFDGTYWILTNPPASVSVVNNWIFE